ncbi:flagellar hook-length control protein FliK [Pseudomonas sp. S75]|uniref:flagellar hook-length control protein FliK n=1 Tax=unclassified Pseudomonas TaxID=196821 RepID=UPI0019037B0B|nr:MULTISPECIES: flagellar hook-length control protein FliK [unclassified Pseudomonas]MBJ9975398.1 flagellar hook-length control protein FliK [Pseudomonas sp. S30]MBK0152628.1 flagellar hook-length control protein FliK [Pseudomonas sp. S75]
MTEINSLAAQASFAAQVAKASLTGELLRLTQAQPGLIPAGQTAQGEVLSLRQGATDFTLLLRLSLADGQTAQVQATTSQPLPPGSQVTLGQLDGSRLAVTVQQASASNIATLTRLDTDQVPVGTLLQGKVLTSQALPNEAGQPAVFRSLVSLLNSAQAGATLAVESPRPLPLGSLLSALVQDDQSLRFVPLSGRQDQLAIAQQLISQQARQASLPALLGALQQLASTPDVDPGLSASASRLLASLPDPGQLGDAKAVAQALGNSGAFLEAKLLTGQGAALTADLKAQLVRLVAQIQPGQANAVPTLDANTLSRLLPSMARSSRGLFDPAANRPPPGVFPLPSRVLQELEETADLQQLLRLAAAAVSRVQSHQLASLQQTGTTETGQQQTTWQAEIALRHGQDFIPLQAKLQREETPEQHADPQRGQRDPLESLWRIELAFDLPPLGPLQVQAQLSQGRLSGQLWAERPQTAELIDSQLSLLRERLLARGLDVGDLACHPGTPPQGPRTRLEQRWVDETA